jgi:hypothetical protein
MRRFLFLAAVIVWPGCAALPDRLAPEYSRVRFVLVSSAAVEILTPRFIWVDHQVYLEGSVRRAFGAGSTEASHLQVSFLRADRTIAAIQSVEFVPAELPRRSPHPYNEGHFRLPILQLPEGTLQIEIRAVGREHA